MKKVYLILSAFFIISCGTDTVPSKSGEAIEVPRPSNVHNIKVFNVDGYDYVALYSVYKNEKTIVHNAN